MRRRRTASCCLLGLITCQSPLQRGQTRARGIADRGSGRQSPWSSRRGLTRSQKRNYDLQTTDSSRMVVCRWVCCWETGLDSRNQTGLTSVLDSRGKVLPRRRRMSKKNSSRSALFLASNDPLKQRTVCHGRASKYEPPSIVEATAAQDRGDSESANASRREGVASRTDARAAVAHQSVCPGFVPVCPEFVPILSRVCPHFVPSSSRLGQIFFVS
jgi:hypothetical protein